MSTILTLGADIAKATYTLWAVAHEHEPRDLGQQPNDPAHFPDLGRQVDRLAQEWGCATIHLILEPTGGYELPLARWAATRGWRVSLPNPRHVRDWSRGLGQRAKTDRQDALLLARYGQAVALPQWQEVPETVRQLEALLARQEDLRGYRQQERNREQALQARHEGAAPEQASLTRTMQYLEEELARLKDEIGQHLDRHPELKAQAKRLEQLPGIGRQNRLFILVFLYRWGALTDYQGDRKGLTAYAGLDPTPQESGTSLRGRAMISRQGNGTIRSKLFMGALGGVRGNNVLRDYYQAMVERGKPKMVALVAAAHKILIWAWAVFRDQSDFDPERAAPRARRQPAEEVVTA